MSTKSSTKSKVLRKKRSGKRVSLYGVLKENEGIKKEISVAADELNSVNDVLKQGKTSVSVIQQALKKNEDAENIVAKAAEDLKRVNIKLSNEIAMRIGIESELDDAKTDLAAVRDDLVQAQVTEKEARQRALTDKLTGLPNRTSFDQALTHGLVQAKRHSWSLAVLFIDVDKFKNINDAHGHDVGDQVLLEVANRLKAFIREGDMVSRWGGDEFVCLLLEVKQQSDVRNLAQQLVMRVAEDFILDGQTLHIHISIGIAIAPQDGETAAILFKHADTAMYKAKALKPQVALFGQL
ncbi:diguanylate cyclase (GGDEF)-like protein [Rheinheimera pacifica]|uniref:GGDEF domain-containing protein n=1 Tax=Rheinheimera pacifica TaxID=173990 RepID=UPI00285CF6C0|nr:GGDEF domain-containing protein [Rheinheimera pacifica]MDR6984127.1 diguanylate cyclase (GGDEF)-like protein [Rheinheimera pacifica]